MSVLELENALDATTHHWSASVTASDQSNPVTRRVALDLYLGELETLEIEHNREFHATIVDRLSRTRADLVEPDDVLRD